MLGREGDYSVSVPPRSHRQGGLLTKAAAPGTWRPSKTGGPRRRQDAGIKAPNEDGEQQGTPLSLERVTMTLQSLSNTAIINTSSKTSHRDVFSHFIMCFWPWPLWFCPGVITEELLIARVCKCVIKPPLDESLHTAVGS